MIKKMNAGVWAGFVVLLFSLVFFFQSMKYPYLSPLGPGPGFFPAWLCGLLFLLSLFYIYVSWKGTEESGEPMPRGRALKNILFILICMILFAGLLSFLGFIASSSLFLFALLYGGYKWYSNAAISIGTSVFLYVLFHTVLSVQLPVNAWGW